MFEKVSTTIKLLALLGILLAGPVTIFAFLLGGTAFGTAALLGLGFFFVVLYMIAFRRTR